MANIVFNIAKGKVAAYHDRVNDNDPANSALILIPIETSGLESDATLIDADTVAAVLSGTTNEQTTMGRKTLTDSDLAASAVDDTNNRNECSLPEVVWTTASGNPISKILVAYDPDTTSGTDANLVPLTMFDCVVSPDGTNVVLGAGTYFRGS